MKEVSISVLAGGWKASLPTLIDDFHELKTYLGEHAQNGVQRSFYTVFSNGFFGSFAYIKVNLGTAPGKPGPFVEIQFL